MTSEQDVAFSAQEQWIKSNQSYAMSERLERIHKQILEQDKVFVTGKRAILFTESFKKTEGQPLVMRWAKANMHVAKNMPISIDNDDLILGRLCEKKCRYANVYPETDGAYLRQAIEELESRDLSPAVVSPEDREALLEVADYWQDKSFMEAYAKALPDEIHRIIFGPDRNNFERQFFVMMSTAGLRSSQNWTPDYQLILDKGFSGLKQELQAQLDALDSPTELVDKRLVYEAMLISCDAAILLANRYADTARELAAKENNAERRAELEKMAAICAHVPEHPARNYHEAIQCHWFVMLMSKLEQLVGGNVSLGRMDQMLNPFYEKDLTEGRITRAEAVELLRHHWLRQFETLHLPMSPSAASAQEGYSHFDPCTIGGQTADGRDATNAMSYIILDSVTDWPCTYPELGARMHSRTPERFMAACCEVIKQGRGIPKLYNDEFMVPFYLERGAPLAEALDYTGSGCMEARLINRESHVTGGTAINYGALINMMFNHGRMPQLQPLVGDHQFGLDTGDMRDCESFEELWDRFSRHLRYIVKQIMTQQIITHRIKGNFYAAPLHSAMHKLCREQARDLHEHDLKDSLHLATVEAVGYSTAIDSLAAIKHLVFDEQSVTMDELIEALSNNFENNDILRQRCVNAPKFGNNIPEVDAIGKAIEDEIGSMIDLYPMKDGSRFMYRCIPVTAHIPCGMVCSATPDGRKAGVYLAEGIGAFHGCDIKGPTAEMQSMAHAQSHQGGTAARLVNQRFSPATVAGPAGTRRFMAYLRTWMNLKLFHNQFNFVNSDTLRAAMKDPQSYRNLIVRVAGYSAYFTELSPKLQQEIIDRSEHQL